MSESGLLAARRSSDPSVLPFNAFSFSIIKKKIDPYATTLCTQIGGLNALLQRSGFCLEGKFRRREFVRLALPSDNRAPTAASALLYLVERSA